MDGTWQIVKWIWVGVCFIWLVVQMLALRRLKGDLKRRSMNVFWVVFTLMMVSDWIRDVFENAEATKIAMVTVGVAAIIATVLLLGILRNPGAGEIADGPDIDIDGHVKSLRFR